MNKTEVLNQIKFNKEGLVPVIIQGERTKQVLMLAYMDRESLEKTLEEGRTCFYSRSRRKLWFKGDTSGNIQVVKKIVLDCDNDTLLVLVEQKGVACHTGNYSCFFKEIKSDKIEEINVEPSCLLQKEQAGKIKSSQGESRGEQSEIDSEIINEIYQVIQNRKLNYKSDSYVCKLLANSEDLLPKKIGEEAVEVIIALKDKDKSAIIYEVADLWFHTLVALGSCNISPQDVFKELKKRRK
ncbi:bifunctional phosphoribosyl-AMP cyclohydrolase/phosphoribosyl-ATP diphosphatase HisIE [bacterium]|nr:bifunctional phosphoribosyl-AMP cyclohydrolase/phosphoribosyl-ATP diphosphatase HisIE [bacterium]MBU4603250.1 bifunctional phosphoribosyl-AMP cyclohydrolase/phosphoribosyl-ATP diphosphatase HisIE [bacterium]